MAEKLLKSLEALKSSSLAATAPLNGQEQNRYEKVLGEQEKISHMNTVAELICSVGVRTSPDFVRLLTASMESILLYCSDRNATVRLNANESLNRIIVGLKESAITRVLWELFKEIKRNARSRSLAAALSRFGELCHLIKASKCRSYVGHLLPSVGRALKRDDELVQETLAAAMVKICPVLAPYMTESELQTLIKSFLSKLHSSSAATRRTASSSLALLCQYAQKQNRTLELLLTGLLNAVSPRCGEENPSSSSVIGVLSCIRQLVPQLSRPVKEDQGIADSFSVELEDLTVKQSSPASSPVISQQIHQLYELVLRCSNHQNHNIVSASLEALHQILSSPSDNFAAFLISQTEKLPKEESTESKQSDSSEQVQSIWDGSREGEPNLEIDEQTMGEFEEDSLIWADSTLKLCELDEEAGDGDGKLSHDVKELEHGESQEASALDNRGDQSVLKPDGESCQSIVGGSYYDSCHENENLVPLAHCILHVCSAFLLPASTGNLISDKVIRVSIKALAVRCVAAAVRLYPKCFLLQLKPKQLNSDDEGGPPQFISDVLLYVEHTDPLLRGEIAMLIGSLVLANLQERKLCFQSWESKVCDDYEPLQMGQLIGLLGKCLDDESTVSRMACSAVKLCLPTLLSSSNGNLGLKLLLKLSDLSKTSYWLVKVELAAVVSCIDYKVVAYLQQQEMWLQASSDVLGIDIQQRMLDVLIELLNDEDFRVRQAVANAFVDVLPRLFFGSKDWNKNGLVAFGAELANSAYPSTVSLETVTQSSLSTGQWKSKQDDGLIIENNLGRVVHLLSIALLKTNQKQSVMGCYQTLNLLADKFPIISYPKAWSTREISLPVTTSTPVSRTTIGGSLDSSPPAQAPEPSKLGPLSLLKFQLRKATPVVSSSDVSARMGTASYKTATEETKTLFLRASSLVPPSRSIEGASSLLSQFTTKDKKMLNKSQRPISGGPLTVALSMLKSSVSLDLQAHQDILLLCAKLLHGCSVQALLSSGTKAVSKIEETDLQWIGLKDRHLVPLIEQIITHVFRLLNVLCHVMEDKEPRPPETKIRDRLLSSSVPSTGPATSPRKKGKASEKDNKTSQSDGEKEKTGKTIKSKDIETESTTREKAPVGSFYQMPYYTSLYESLKGSFGNYKVTVDTSVPEKFGSMLKTTLKALALILELACVEDIGKYTGEVINYMCITVQFCPSETYFCVEQLLNALFGANPAAQPGAIPAHLYSPYQPNITSFSPSIYDVCIIQPSVWLKNQVVDIQTTARDFDTMPSEGKPNASFLKWMKSRRRKSVWAFVGRPDVGPIVKYIEAFEPLVIRSLRQYTGTGDADLQRQILQLLIQLIRLRVNYSMLDAEQAFLKYVVSQVEHIEDGYVRDSSSLIPYIFRFLVLLSYERSQPSIINVPRLIQLCDGVMAVGVAAEDYTIPSLRPVVYDLFVARNSSSMEPDKRLETQREVVISILNRIVQHQEVLSMLVIVLQASQISLDKWITQSKMILSNLVPRLRQQQVELESHSALATLHLLFTSLATCTLCPISQFVDLLLKKPLNRESKGLARWLSGVLASLRVITAVCSESELLREIANADAESWLSDVCPWLGCCPYSDSCDVFAWKLFGLMNFLVTAIQSHCLPYQHIGVLEEFLCELILQFILMVHLVLETFPAVLAASKRICQRLEDMTKDLTAKFLLLISCQPFLVTSWCHLLSLIEYQSEWWDYLSVKLVTLPNPPTESTMKACSSSEEQQYRPTQTQDLLLDPLISVSEPLNMRWKLVKDVALAMQSEQLIKLGVQDSIANFIQLTACDLARLQNERAVVELLKTVQGSGQLSDVFVKCLCTKLSTSLPLNLKKKMIVSFLFVHPSCIATVLHFLLGTVRCCALMPFVETVCTSLVERLTELHHQDGHPYFSQDEVVELEKAVLAAVRPSVKFKKLLKLLNYQVVQLQNESIDSAHFLAAGSQRHIEPTTDLKKFTQYVSAMCINSQSAPSTCHAQLLHCLSHNTILKILRHEQFDIRLLKFCISLGAQDTIRLLAKQGSFEEYDLEMEHIGLDTSEYFDEHGTDHLLDASRTVMFERIEQLLSQRNHCTPDSGATSVVPDQLSDNSQLSIVPLASALSKYLDYVSDIPKADIPHDGTEWLPAVLLDCLKHAFWLWQKIPSEDIISLLKCSAKILKNRRVYSMLCKSQRSQWCYNFVNILFEFVQLLLLGSQTASIQTVQTHEVPYTSTKEMATDSTTQVHSRICSLVHWLNETQCLKSVPQSVSRPLQSLVINLARLPALELHARTPASLVGRINAIGDSSGRVRGASISSEDLRDEDVLIDYVARVLTLGWRNRQQFEVTWVTLQGLLSPPAPLDELPDEETVEVYKVTCVAVKAITSLLVQTLLAPTPGHPAGSQLLHTCRQKELPFLGSRAGKKLLALCSIIELSTPSTCESTLPIFRSNTERPLNTCEYGSGQLNVTSLQVRVVTSDVRSVEDQPDDESNSVFSMHPHEVVETVDVKSCLQLLLELYAQWLDTSVSPRPPIMLIFEIMKSAVILSDVFEEFWHFQWLLEHCLRLAATNMSEDEQILQYLILGACKASAVLRNEQYTERVAKLALLGLSASQEAAQVLTLHGILYILEAHAGADMKVLLPSLSDYVISLLLQTACGEVQICHEYQMTLWSTAFFLVEQYSDDLKITDFSARVVKVALVFLSAGDVAPLPVYVAVIHCLERLLLSFTLSKSDREAVSKVALERYDSLTAKRSLPALGLLLTYLYTGKSGDQASGISQLEKETLNDPGMEDQVAVLEKLTRILDRMHKALPAEATVVARVLPSLLQDFMPRYQIMTKVVGEFLSSQQPYPGLMAEVMFKVFENLIQKNELEFVTEWVLLSLGSVIQRTPLGMAIWSLNCLFVCSSLNGPIRAQYPQFSV